MQVRKSDMSTYIEDLAAVRPTQMSFVPRLANIMYDEVLLQLQDGPDSDDHAKAVHKQACVMLPDVSASQTKMPFPDSVCNCFVFRLRTHMAALSREDRCPVLQSADAFFSLSLVVQQHSQCR